MIVSVKLQVTQTGHHMKTYSWKILKVGLNFSANLLCMKIGTMSNLFITICPALWTELGHTIGAQ